MRPTVNLIPDLPPDLSSNLKQTEFIFSMKESEFIKVEDTDLRKNIEILKKTSPYRTNDLHIRRSSTKSHIFFNFNNTKGSKNKNNFKSFKDSLDEISF